MKRAAYYVSTGLFSAMIALGVVMYFAQHEMVSESFAALGYPTYIIYPLAMAKALGLIAIWTKVAPRLTEFAYAGFFYDLVLAILAHTMIGDGEWMGAAVAMLLLVGSYTSRRLLERDRETS